MKIGEASGLQVAFLMFAVMILSVPLSSAVIRAGDLEGGARTLVQKGGHFFLATTLLLAVSPLRRAVTEMLRRPIRKSMRKEVVAAWLLSLVAAFGGMAALALWSMAQAGPAWTAQVTRDADRHLANAYTAPALVILLLSSTIGPVIEEIVFRGFIYRAFERQWGWLASLVATSALFGLYHPHFWSAFTSSVVLICVLRRTGSLRASILVHMAFNFLLWPPLLGQYVLPRPEALADPASWIVHGACLAIALVAVPAYVYMARERPVAATLFIEPDGVLQK